VLYHPEAEWDLVRSGRMARRLRGVEANRGAGSSHATLDSRRSADRRNGVKGNFGPDPDPAAPHGPKAVSERPVLKNIGIGDAVPTGDGGAKVVALYIVNHGTLVPGPQGVFGGMVLQT
jgi:hypothetical protein